MHGFITGMKNLLGNGNCGYRVIAHQLGDNDDKGWKAIRKDMLCELDNNLSFYEKLWPDDEIKKMRNRNKYSTGEITEEEWFVMPEDAQVAAQAFRSVVVFISDLDNITFFPHQTSALVACHHRVIVIAFVNRNHFIGLNLEPNAPIPPPYYLWVRHSPVEAKSWLPTYEGRITEWRRIRNIIQNANPDDDINV
ncbi:hypothetical protein BVC80_8207g9 [Macleaya cordata]|uniref:Ovarian tumor n=1 Tax=Macleaya cordata TaxID=56857 RepID=A0A200QMQ4_MACCD|nr:hypothetical protein BVC80_8207g9 [Macleaya cordata]